MPFEIVRNDITKMSVDAIVNAANSSLLGGGGVDGAIHLAAGPDLLKECAALGGCKTGQAKITGGYRLPCRYVIHTVGPVWHGGNRHEPDLLASCYRESLLLAEKHGCESVAFPLISSGAYGYPKDQAIRIATDTIRDFLMEHDMTVYLVVFGPEAYAISRKLYAHIQAYIDDTYIGPDYEARESLRRRRNLMTSSLEEADTCESVQPPPLMAPRPVKEARPEHKSRFGREALPAKETRPAEDPLFNGTLPVEGLSPSAALDDWLAQIDEGFREMLFRKIDEKHMTDAECYKKANIDRKLFNKIKNQPDYKPGKTTVLALAIALKLPPEELREMLGKAGFSLSRSSKSDLIVEYYIEQGNYDIFEINEALFSFDQKLLGSLG